MRPSLVMLFVLGGPPGAPPQQPTCNLRAPMPPRGQVTHARRVGRSKRKLRRSRLQGLANRRATCNFNQLHALGALNCECSHGWMTTPLPGDVQPPTDAPGASAWSSSWSRRVHCATRFAVLQSHGPRLVASKGCVEWPRSSWRALGPVDQSARVPLTTDGHRRLCGPRLRPRGPGESAMGSTVTWKRKLELFGAKIVRGRFLQQFVALFHKNGAA